MMNFPSSPTNGQTANGFTWNGYAWSKAAADTSVAISGDIMSGNLSIATSNPAFVLDKAASGETNQIVGYTAGAARWRIDLGDYYPESAGNVGSDFSINRFGGGTYLGTPINIRRTSGSIAAAGAAADIATKSYAVTLAEGVTGHSITTSVAQNLPATERYGAFVGQYSSGTSDPTVPGCTFGLGVAALKENWWSTPRAGQFIGIGVTTRSGFTGVNPEPYAYSGGDTAALITNSVQANSDNFSAILEGVSYYMPNGNQVAGTRGMRIQLGAIKDSLDIAHGVIAIAAEGDCDTAFRAQTSSTTPTAPGLWRKFLSFFTEAGTGVFEAFQVDYIGRIIMRNQPTESNQKVMLRIGPSGEFDFVNNALTGVSTSISQLGDLRPGRSLDLATATPPPPAYGRVYFDNATAKLKICIDNVSWRNIALEP